MALRFKKMGIAEVLIGLREVAANDTRYTAKAQGLLGWYAQKGEFTSKQLAFGANIIEQSRRKLAAKPKPKHYKLYAIDDGVNIKLGYSGNPKSRLKEMQTGQASKLAIVWELAVGDVKVLAEKAERQLHRYCHKHRKRGEWFHRDCMTLVRQFELKRQIEEERKDQIVEMEIVSLAAQRL